MGRGSRIGGWSPPERLRVGGSPGEIDWRDDPLNNPALSDLVKERALAFRLLTGARLAFEDGAPDVIAYPEDRIGWGKLTRLLTLGNRRAEKGHCLLRFEDLLSDPDRLMLVLAPDRRTESLKPWLERLNEANPGAVWLGAAMHRQGDDRRRLAKLRTLSAEVGAPLLATNDALYHDAGERDLQHVMTCICVAGMGRRTWSTPAPNHPMIPTNSRRFWTAPWGFRCFRNRR